MDLAGAQRHARRASARRRWSPPRRAGGGGRGPGRGRSSPALRARPAPARCPAGSTVSPAAMSSPARRTFSPGATAALDQRRRSPSTVGVLDPHRGVGAGGEHRAGRDRDRLAGFDRVRRRVPGARLVDDRQVHRRVGRGPGDLGGAHREAVHRRVVEGLELAVGDRVERQPPAQRLAEPHVLRRRQRAPGRGSPAAPPRPRSLSPSPHPAVPGCCEDRQVVGRQKPARSGRSASSSPAAAEAASAARSRPRSWRAGR